MSIADRLTTQSERHLVGTIKSQAQRGVFYFSMYNFAQILFLSYEGGAYSGIFPNFWVYFAAHALAFAAIVAFDFRYILSGEKAYQKRQEYARDPLRDDVQQLEDEIQRLRAELGEHDD